MDVTMGTPDASVPDALAFAGVSFAYAATPAVEDVSVRIRRGEMVGLLGPNGAGKSTLLGLASGALKAGRGAVAVNGADIRRIARRTLARTVAVVPQEFTVQFAYTVRQIIELGRGPHMGLLGIPGTADRRAIDSALAATETRGLADRVFHELSGGERQRVVVALALAQEPDLLLLDEPTAHLDVKHQIEVLELVRRLNAERGLTVVAALHDLNLAARYFPRLLLFYRRIVADGPPARVLDGALLSRVYGTPVQVGILRGEEHLSVLPQTGDRQAGERADRGIHRKGGACATRVHVLAGGGSGELLMRALADAGIVFTVGPLNVGDSDHALARRLAAACLEEPPAAPISAWGLAAARAAMAAADATVLCPMPLGPGNIALLDAALDAALEAASEARDRGAVVLLLEPDGGTPEETPEEADARVQARDFSGRGPALYRALLAAGARRVATPAEALALLQRLDH